MEPSRTTPPEVMPPGHAGASSLLVALGKVATSRLLSVGVPVSPRRHLEIAEALDRGRAQYSCSSGHWRVSVELNWHEDRGLVEVAHLGPSGRWNPQDAPDGTPACAFVERGVDPLARHDEYHYLRRTLHQSEGQRWDPSRSVPAEVARREDGSVEWTRRFLRDCPSDRGRDLPALQSYWPSGLPQVARRVSECPSGTPPPVYAEFYPDGTPALEIFSPSLLLARFPDGRVVERKDWKSPGEATCARVFASATPLDFDAANFSPHLVFLDEFPEGGWRLNRCLHPDDAGLAPRSATWQPAHPLKRPSHSPARCPSPPAPPIFVGPRSPLLT